MGYKQTDNDFIYSPIARHAVIPGDSMPIKFIKPVSPRSPFSRMTKSIAGSPGPWIFGRMPLMSGLRASIETRGRYFWIDL